MTATGSWCRPAACPRLQAGEVHLWRIALDRPPAPLAVLRSNLSYDELERAERFRFAKDRDRFVVGRGLLRSVLGRYLGTAPHELHFAYGPAGKPALAGPSGGPAIEFNVSHAGGLALVAVALGRRVGVDVEQVRILSDMDQIVADVFPPGCPARFRAVPAEERQRAFFVAWARVEACLKGTGEGIGGSLRGLDVFAKQDGVPDTWEDPSSGARWSLVDLDPAPGFAGALVVEGRELRLSCWDHPACP